MNEKDLVEKFNVSSKQFVIAYGGDGVLLRAIERYGASRSIIPIRNYGRCAKHISLLTEIAGDEKECKHLFRYSKQHFIDYSLDGNSEVLSNGKKFKPASEVVWKCANPTEALRFSVLVNGKEYMKQCIADGIICSTALGSHGYFKSVTRTLFNDTEALGLGFIAPTYGLCNLVLKSTDKVSIVLERDASTVLSGDKCFKTLESKVGSQLELQLSVDGVSLLGYDIFCCAECRKLRNSTSVNDQYIG